MKYILSVTICFLFLNNSLISQSADSTSSEYKAKAFLRQGDYTNAIMLLNKAALENPNGLEIQKDLAFAYYLKRDFVKGLEVAKPIVERKDADVQSFQILGLIYKAIEERKECEKMYKAGLKRFPNSGVLYNEYGEMLWTKQEFGDAVKLWERGILSEPGYPGNYYNAAKYYYFSADKIWGILYGEIFVNLESFSKRTAEIQTQLFDGYKKLFTDADIMKNQDNRSEFATAVLQIMKKHAGLVANGISTETLTALRKSFITDWFQQYPDKFRFRLFEYQNQLLKSGMFDAYNQWLFASVNDVAGYKKWAEANSRQVNNFASFQKNRVFKIPKGQYFQNTKW
jgi:Tfp pilus assembly protein PilF